MARRRTRRNPSWPTTSILVAIPVGAVAAYLVMRPAVRRLVLGAGQVRVKASAMRIVNGPALEIQLPASATARIAPIGQEGDGTWVGELLSIDSAAGGSFPPPSRTLVIFDPAEVLG